MVFPLPLRHSSEMHIKLFLYMYRIENTEASLLFSDTFFHTHVGENQYPLTDSTALAFIRKRDKIYVLKYLQKDLFQRINTFPVPNRTQ